MYFDIVKSKRDFLVGKLEKINEDNYEEQQELVATIMENMFSLEHRNHSLYKELLGILFSDYIRLNLYEASIIEENPDPEFIKEVESIEDLTDLEFMVMEDGELLYKFLKFSTRYNLMSDLEKTDVNLRVDNAYLGSKILEFNPGFILESLVSAEFYTQDIETLTKTYDHEYCLDYLKNSKLHKRVNFLNNLKKMVKMFYAWYFSLSNHISIELEAKNMLKRIENSTIDELETFLIEYPELLDYLLEIYEYYLADEHLVKNETVIEETLSKADVKVINNWFK